MEIQFKVIAIIVAMLLPPNIISSVDIYLVIKLENV
jgi:hypothetical protein